MITALTLAAALLLTTGCGDPHKGQVLIDDGNAQVWITPAPGVPVSSFTSEQFSVDENGVPAYSGSDYTTMRGIDVSYYQKEVDWKAVAKSGVEFAFIRCGYRGYSKGAISTDEQFAANIQGALKAGIKVGVYFFSQAINVEEAKEEARYALELIAPYKVTLPVVFDWENIESGDGDVRTAELDGTTLTDCALAFCETVKAGGYTPCVYFYRHTGYYSYDLSRLTDYTFWLSRPGTYPDFYYAHAIWQYSFEGQVPGIEGSTDMNLMFIPVIKG